MSGLGKLAVSLRTSVYVLRYYSGRLRDREILLLGDSPEMRDIERALRDAPDGRRHKIVALHGEGLRCAWHMAAARRVVACGKLPDWWTKRDGQFLTYLADAAVAPGFDAGAVQRGYLCADLVACRGAKEWSAVCESFGLDGLYRGKYTLRGDAQSVCAQVLTDGADAPVAPAGEKQNVLLLCGALRKNGLTSSLLNLLSQIDLGARNYYLSFPSNRLADDPSRLDRIPREVRLFPLPDMRQESALEKLATQLYFRKNRQWRWVTRLVKRYFARLYRRSYAGCEFCRAIDCDGYNPFSLNMLLYGRESGRGVYVHNDMLCELKTRHNQHRPTLERAYRAFEYVIPVTRDIVEPTARLSGRSDNIRVVNNCHDWQGVRRRASEPVSFDADTESNVPLDALEAILAGDSLKIVTIGRFSPEKAHAQLIEAFARFQRQRPDSYLILIGGHGELYDRTKRLAAELGCEDRVALIRSLKNPMPILKRCDLFVLSSIYEGLGLVILEADSLGVPAISTDIPGPHGFMRAHGGALVEPSADGIYRGLLDFAAGKIRPMNVDYAAYNRQAVAEFESLFKD